MSEPEPLPHEFNPESELCAHCGSRLCDVVARVVSPNCTHERRAVPVEPPPPSLNHGGPGICRMCYPLGAPAKLRNTCETQPTQQGELAL